MITTRARLAVAIGAVASLLAAILSPTLAQEGHNPFKADPGWALVDQRTLDFDGELVALSPDGQWIAGTGPDREFCVWEVTSLDATCIDQEFPVQEDAIRWAPDSSAVAWSIDALRYLYDSDIFVFELATGEATNLTDDDFADTLPLGSDDTTGPIPVDIMPAWTPDSQSLVFIRSVWNLDPDSDAPIPTDLLSIDRAGGEPTHVATVRDDYPWAVFLPMAVLGDGSILYTMAVSDLSDTGIGLWRLESDGTATQVMPGADSADYPAPAITDVRETPDGVTVSGYSPILFGQSNYVEDAAFLLDLETGEVTPIASAEGEERASSPVRFGPDGVSTIGMDWLDGEPHVVIRNANGTADLGTFEPGRGTFSRGIEWAANDTILITSITGDNVLLTVAGG